MRFLVDGMLGKVARWLRLLGYEVDYDPRLNDTSLLDLAEKEQAVLLTRDEELYARANGRRIQTTLVVGDSEETRLARLASVYGIRLDVDMSLTRCPKCGSSLTRAEKTAIVSVVPETTFRLYDEYWKCSNVSCGKVYWRGGHWKNIEKTLGDAKKLLEAP